jgi:hypothetical protein
MNRPGTDLRGRLLSDRGAPGRGPARQQQRKPGRGPGPGAQPHPLTGVSGEQSRQRLASSGQVREELVGYGLLIDGSSGRAHGFV